MLYFILLCWHFLYYFCCGDGEGDVDNGGSGSGSGDPQYQRPITLSRAKSATKGIRLNNSARELHTFADLTKDYEHDVSWLQSRIHFTLQNIVGKEKKQNIVQW
jgi:hypothetical protein